MTKHSYRVLAMMLLAGSVWGQDAPSIAAAPVATPDQDVRLSPPELPGGKVGLVRGVVKRTDPIHDQFVITAFGGRDVRIDFDTRTRLLPENSGMHLTSIPAGVVVSIDTVIDNGKLFARSVRTGSSAPSAVELNGKVVRYDTARARLILRDPLSPENESLRVTPSTVVVDKGQAASVQMLSPGMLVRVSRSTAEDTVSRIEILARLGDSFIFAGRILSVDLRSRVLALSNDTDQSIRELAIGSLDATNLALLREGSDVSIRAQFDGDRYNAQSVSLVKANP